MIKLFRRNKITIKSISIPDFGWNLEKNNSGIIQWINAEQTMALSVNFFDLQPDIPTSKNIEVLRDFYRTQIAAANGGLVEVELIQLNGIDVVRTIFKIPQEPSGMTYLASLTIPFKNYSYVVKIQAPEVGATGMRDSSIAMKLMSKGEISIGEEGYEGWAADPYDSEFKVGALMNKSEAVEYDEQFPNHPLSQVRQLLPKLEQEIHFSEAVLKTDKFKK